MNLRTTCLCLFVASAVVLTSCKSNPLGGFSRMGQAMGRSVGIGSGAENDRAQPLRLDSGEIERARAATGAEENALPEPAAPRVEDQVALAR
ncbi:MAG: hypothetical protein ACAH88_15415 [Roseimicrobium sp.]